MGPVNYAKPPMAPARLASDPSDSSSAPSISHKGEAASTVSASDLQAHVPPLSASLPLQPLAPGQRDKAHEILTACKDGNLTRLRQLATSEGGLIEDQVRRTAWPILLGCKVDQHGVGLPAWRTLSPHRDENQVHLDVNRSFIFYPEDEPEARKDSRKVELSNVITEVLRIHPMLHYFQGYHDIVQVLLLVLGANAATPAAACLSLLRIRDFMLPSMSGTESHLHLLPAILHDVDPTLFKHLSQTQPFFALGATLTLYAHDIEEYGDIARLFDFLLAHEAVMSLYLFAVNELMEIDADEPEMLHATLSKLPKPLDLEGLIRHTLETFTKHPPERLPGRAWAKVSSNSVLKTTRDPQQLSKQTLQDGERLFERHDAEIKQQEARARRRRQARQLVQRYRRPATYTSIAVLVAVMAMMLRNSGEGRASPAGWILLFTGLRQKAVDMLRQCFS